jgi:hypothetical protein
VSFHGKAVKVDGERLFAVDASVREKLKVVWLITAWIVELTPKSTTIMALRFACFA